ncbi:DNA-binding transcriptional MocR family regulator [Paraburkholderia bannensis]|uniref:DNA-binding transcriptional MocR family regulator n=1 Tax=Paraburkholderia bannensis TaxID=765414 RepID=A0A7W9WRP7_9BURK|nr:MULTISPECIES: PLP-dependent aminotransferase family protein [Paraburkholderia]MBB3256715.1 DNA-binding transcriptional MocR family regulator [Paraburkholderia sp. WP4_3_2]MBB6101714.1 DNA-binding transcriptional MocR family regulator [Paraburkholderia bannensis]
MNDRSQPNQQPLYRQLAGQYRRSIESGVLRAGDRMPSMRAFMRQHEVSLATATESYRVLEREALIEARPREGYFVRAVASTLPAAREPEWQSDWQPEWQEARLAQAQFVGIHANISALVARWQQVPDALNLGGVTAADALFPGEALQKIAVRTLRHRPDLLTAPGHERGDPRLRAVIARRALTAGFTVHPDEIVMTHGGTEAVNLALRAVTQPGDTVAVESPCFYGLLQVLESLGLRALEIPASPTTGLSVEALEFALRQQAGESQVKALVVVPHIQNPLGCVMQDAHKQRIVELCSEAGVAVIEDDPYRELVESDAPPRALKSWDTQGDVIHCTSFNKTLAPGMRVGWMAGGRWHSRIAMLKFAQSRLNEPLSQAVLAEFLQSQAHERHLRRLRERLALQRARMAQGISASFPAGTRFTPPRGGMAFWIELPPGVDSMALFDAALSERIRIMPGTVFSNSNRFDRFIRVSCPGPDPQSADAALARLGAIAHRLAAQKG